MKNTKGLFAALIFFVTLTFCGYVEGKAATTQTATKAGHAETATKANKATKATKAGKAAQIVNKAGKVAKKDRKQIEKYCSRFYPGYKVVITKADNLTDKQLYTRKNKHIIYIAAYNTKADSARAGHVTGGRFKDCYITYAHKAKAGRKYKVYWIYEPNTNSIDSIAAIVSGGKLK